MPKQIGFVETLVAIIVLALGITALYFFYNTIQKDKPNAPAVGNACGGFAGEMGQYACTTGYYCKYPTPAIPDGQGICTKK